MIGVEKSQRLPQLFGLNSTHFTYNHPPKNKDVLQKRGNP